MNKSKKHKSSKDKNTKQRPAKGAFSEEEVQQWFEDEETELPSDSIENPSSETIAEKYTKSQLRVVRETKDYTLDYLQHALEINTYIINVSPEYQRRQRWPQKKRSQLIESFLMNIPIPPIFLFEKDYNEYEVVDGRQRLDTIRDYLSNSFPLSGLRYWTELNGKRFNQLPSIIQRGLLRRSLSAIVLLAETRRPKDDDFDIRTVLFDRLNTGGEKLNPQELRNALYPGRFNKLLIELARSDDFTSVWGIPPKTREEEAEEIPEDLSRNTLYRTMADCELVLRFFAIREALMEDRKGSLRRLLDSCMEKHRHDLAETIDELRHLYTNSLTTLSVVFDGSPFVLSTTIKKPSRPVYDALMVALSLQGGTSDSKKLQARSKIKASLSKALKDADTYDVLVGRGNTIESIRQRVRLASKILFGSKGSPT
jgi:hypothetical protein